MTPRARSAFHPRFRTPAAGVLAGLVHLAAGTATATPPPVEPLRGLLILDARGGFDNYHNLATGEGFSDFRQLAAGLGLTVTPRQSFLPEDLAGAQAVVLLQPFAAANAYSLTELGALQNFVNAGGGLLVVGEGGSGSSATYLNDLTSTWGVTFASTPANATGATFGDLLSHPLTAGVGQVSVDYHRPLTITAPALDLTLGNGSANVLAVHGGAVFLSDSSILMNPDAFSDASLASAGNGQLARNIVHYLATVPEPSHALLAALGLLGWAVRRPKSAPPATS